MNRLIECVPNFSEGRNADVINLISESINTVQGVKILNVDMGWAVHRTVITFIGEPEAVCEAAFRATKTASELIDMSIHKGEHPRIGATDVLPLIPISGITMEELVVMARELASRIGTELEIPIFQYEFSAIDKKRKLLANCRSGEYEGLSNKLKDKNWTPDYGPKFYSEKIAKTGATIVGARNFLIAFNVNLNINSAKIANLIATEIREKGSILKDSDGNLMKDENGDSTYKPGLLKSVRGIGWYIQEYGVAQLSFNLTDISVNSLHHVFEASCHQAGLRGVNVTGSELIGLVPLKAMLDAGIYYLNKMNRDTNIAEEAIIEAAILFLGLDDKAPFDYRKRIIDYLIN